MSSDEKEEMLADKIRNDYETSLRSDSISVHGIRFNYYDGCLESVEWEDPGEFIAQHHERLTEDAIGEDDRNAQRVLSYAWLLVRQAEEREKDAELKKQGLIVPRAVEVLNVDEGLESYLEELINPEDL